MRFGHGFKIHQRVSIFPIDTKEIWAYEELWISKDCTITINSGVTVYVHFDLINEGTLVNNGVLVVDYSFANAGKFTNNGTLYVGSEEDKSRTRPVQPNALSKGSTPEHPVFKSDGFCSNKADTQVLKNSPDGSVLNNGTINITSTQNWLVGLTNHCRSGKAATIKNAGTINLNCLEGTVFINESGAAFDNGGTIRTLPSANWEGQIAGNAAEKVEKFAFASPEVVAKAQIQSRSSIG